MGPDGKLVPCRVTGRGSYSSVGSAAFASTAARPHQQVKAKLTVTAGMTYDLDAATRISLS